MASKSSISAHSCKKCSRKETGSCKCCKSGQPCSLCKKHKHFMAFYRPLAFAFGACGLKISCGDGHRGGRSSSSLMFSKVIVILMHLFLLYRLGVLAFRIRYSGYTVKLASALFFRESVILAIWHSVRCKRSKIAELLSKMQKMTGRVSGNSARRRRRVFYGTLAVIFVNPLVVTAAMTSMLDPEEAGAYEYRTTFGAVTPGYAYHVNFLLFLAYNYYLMTLPFLVATMFVLICSHVHQTLRYFTLVLERSRQFDSRAERVLDEAIQALHFLEDVEDAMSPSVFFVVTMNLALCFTSFAYVLGYYEMTYSASAGVADWMACNIVSFVLVVWTASGVNIESSRLKRTVVGTLARFESELDSERASFLLLRFLQFDVAALTGWQMFDFSRGMILSAFGSILTYGLLILQTKSTDGS